jgi:hypothetical protein
MGVIADLPPEILGTILDRVIRNTRNGNTMALLLNGNNLFTSKLCQALTKIRVPTKIKQIEDKASIFDKYVSEFSNRNVESQTCGQIIEHLSQVQTRVDTIISRWITNWNTILKFTLLSTLKLPWNILDFEVIKQIENLRILEGQIVTNFNDDKVFLPNIVELKIQTRETMNFSKVFPNLIYLNVYNGMRAGVDTTILIDVSALQDLRYLYIQDGSDRCTKVLLGIKNQYEALCLKGWIQVDFDDVDFSKLSLLKIRCSSLIKFDGSGNDLTDHYDLIAQKCKHNLKTFYTRTPAYLISKLDVFTNLKKLVSYDGGFDCKPLINLPIEEIRMTYTINVSTIESLPQLKFLRRLIMDSIYFDYAVVKELKLDYLSAKIERSRSVSIIPYIVDVRQVHMIIGGNSQANKTSYNNISYDNLAKAFIKNHQGIIKKINSQNVCRHFSFNVTADKCTREKWTKIFDSYIKLGYMDSFQD